MKTLTWYLMLILGTAAALQSTASRGGEGSAGVDLDTIGAVEAMAVANAWKWTRRDVKSYVNSREVVFEFADGAVKRIPLPEDKMLVAVAPYENRTHE